MNKVKIKENKFRFFLNHLFVIWIFCFSVYKVYYVNHNEDIILNFIFIVLCGTIILFFIKKLVSNKNRVVLSENYLQINSDYLNLKPIKWLDITAIKTTNRFYDKWILIFVKNPEQYIETENWITQKITKFNIYRNGTLFKINTNTLQIKHKDLILLLKEYIEKQNIDNQLTIEDWKNLGVHLN
jgi:hypothetical protein